jgi:hypothetical protein
MYEKLTLVKIQNNSHCGVKRSRVPGAASGLLRFARNDDRPPIYFRVHREVCNTSEWRPRSRRSVSPALHRNPPAAPAPQKFGTQIKSNQTLFIAPAKA